MAKKIIITGGHLSPSLPVIRLLLNNSWEIIFAGREHTLEGDKSQSVEHEIIKSMGIKFVNINAGRLQRKLTKYTLSALLKVPLGFFQALLLINKERPDIVLSFGGYPGLPFAASGWLLKIPVVIHEQTLSPGLANKIASHFATKICVSFNSTMNLFPKNKTVLTGLPLRGEIFKIDQHSKFFHFSRSERPVIYITGGNQGSHTINLLIEKILDCLLQNFAVIHQTGGSLNFRDYERLKEKENEHYFVEKYISLQDIGTVFSVSKFVVGRSGANTVFELAALNKPAILIPIPWSSAGEQEKNAKKLEELGLARVLDQNNLTGEGLLSEINQFWENLDGFAINNHDFQVLEKNASANILKIINEIAKK